jgi:serine/threonine protein kinase
MREQVFPGALVMADRVGQQLGNYHLVRLLGRGGQAEVYLGEHRYLHSHAALKVLHASLDDQLSEQFLAEAQTLARLSHPSIVRVLDYIVEQATPVLIMDYSPAGTMRQRYPAGTCVPLATVVSAVSQVASALQYAHTHHVIHRDVKPENLLLGPRDEVLLSDFGLSVFAPSPELLSTQAMAGTLPYMAPEQLQGHPCFASDQYSLAIVAYEWLTGRRPFTGSQWQLIQQHLEAAPPPLRQLNPSVPQALEAVVLRALAKDPGQRYVSVHGFAQALLRASQQAQAAPAEDPEQTLPLVDSPSPSTQAVALTQRTHIPSSQEQARTPQVSSASPSLAPDQQDRARLLKALGRAYREALESSLQGVASIRLTMRERLDLTEAEVPTSWKLPQKEQLLPEGTSILDVYDDAATGLLILGNPGAGKSTLLYELAQALIKRAQQEEQHPLPVVLNLPLWAAKQLPLEDWIVEQLELRYTIPRKLSRRWLQEERWLLLLDGLDEVAHASRSACVEAINTYLSARTRLVSPVVCSRLEDYEVLSQPLRLSRVVVVQPLTAEQVESYLTTAGRSLAAVREVIQQNVVLRELLTTPLMLHVVTLAYQGKAVEDLPQLGTPEELQRYIFASYLQRMLPTDGKRSPPSSRDMLPSLVWLAQQMRRRSQSILYLEQLQPDWLAGPGRQLLYQLSVGLIGGLLGLFVGLLVVLITGLGQGLIGGLLFGLFIGLRVGLKRHIHVAEVLTWSWKWGIIVWPSLLVFSELPKLLSGPGTLGRLAGSLAGGGLLTALAQGLVAGFSTTQLDARMRLTPNQGIWRSARNGLIRGLFAGLIVGLVGGLFGGLGNGLLVGLLVGLLSWLDGGLDAFLQHFILRFWLWRTGCLPWNLVAHLDEAAQRILLRKVGGGYRFLHELFRDFLATLA